MNIERYKWPVIVAASLHGALLLYTPDKPPVCWIPSAKVDPGPTPPVVEPIEMRNPEDVASGEPGGAVSQLPTLKELPPPAELREVLTVPMVDRTAPDKPITDLKIPKGGIGGPEGEGPGKFGPPTLPGARDLDRPPRPVVQPAPDYPYSLRQAGIAGSVTIEFIVGTDGHVISAEATRSTHREFTEPAVRAVLHWKFEPGTINGRKVRFRMAVPIEFNASS